MSIRYKEFIEDNFQIIDETGEKRPFIFNDIQDQYYITLQTDYGTDLKGLRENILKARREGFSSFIEGLFMADFILSTIGKLPVISGQVVSHKAEEVKPHIKRSNLFLDSYVEKMGITRKQFLKTDNTNYIESVNGAEYYVGTAGAKTLGRGGTLQNLHWTEMAFYPNTQVLNAENIVMPAEQQVADGIGKIFRESTGNTRVDSFAREYLLGKSGETEFNSRFYPWFHFGNYRKQAPTDWQFSAEQQQFMLLHGLDRDQMYWYVQKVLSKRGATEDGEDRLRKAKREYPTTDVEAFLVSGEMYFNSEAIEWYLNNIKEASTRDLIYV
jgi:hypothetical protein